jgi:DNA-binding Lrp family transcriptional regulator
MRAVEHDSCVDDIDHAIVDELRRDARLTNTELADRVGLTPSPCLRRVRRLEGDGVIVGYRARVDPNATGRGFEVIVNVSLASHELITIDAFERTAAGFEEVVELRRMFGRPDYFLRIAVADLAAYEAFLTGRLMSAPGLATFDSHITMKTIKVDD